ncbi:MAG: 50S ribosomal protein L6 [Armatimonadota bacterium]
MSRIGKMPIPLPKGVTVTVAPGNEVTVKGPLAELNATFSPDLTIVVEDGVVLVTRPSDVRHHRALHGLTRSLVANMVTGVAEGFSKRLEIQGVGYRAEKQGDNLLLRLGFSHPCIVEPRPGITLEIEGNTNVIVKGSDKQAVGQTAAEIRKLRKVEPYRGKGVRYAGEIVRRKAGKSKAG